ncbi:3-phenylpropionate/cinnamic acid dioxygenase subunit beta [Alcaligenes faecalis]|jgi:3-phenylpropionate/trans-cinnamate dioxygenase beta subunit|uniref:3-phenylpropionate dioxygenase n=1 Tax=Alcaligenes faecalis TaxID=511 RepID=A0A0M7FWD3_ALCFA|nr:MULTISPECIES: 3-phenylpropionate/cinnamic acid dioxygenase subunit beta [Alcaligenes]MBX6963085.1 3-phenylpropionate/cinnamic acid dioxygenase subunit beta [Providencia rettgeri]MDK7587669.1 3-phenylpropionate/cinnamic acid dioxygenase subunit beta [Alcaligenes phenolicus]ALO37533.1 3-phenylpropionate dioxygenase [Alcaligenes faecalis]ARP54585.1 3-phenylpropionate dioxygenase subunit beta [Alcaligenes faecalis]ATI00507.1 3-phenylpropionate dioxygenase [Alcaligenes faecalis]
MSAVIEEPTQTAIVDMQLHHEIADFLYMEAELLDDWQFRDWLDLLSEDIHYHMRSTSNAQTRDRRRSVQPPTTWIFNDNKFQLERRVARLETGMAWAEEPPSRTRHFVSNLRIRPSADGQGYEIRSNYILYRAQKEKDETWYAGKRLDYVRRADNRFGWELYEREIVLDQVVITSHNLSVLF